MLDAKSLGSTHPYASRAKSNRDFTVLDRGVVLAAGVFQSKTFFTSGEAKCSNRM